MPVLTIVAQIKAKPGEEAEIKEVLTGLLAPTRAEDGCLTYDLHVDNEDPGFFLFYENWQSKRQCERHMDAPHLEAFKGCTDELVADWNLH